MQTVVESLLIATLSKLWPVDVLVANGSSGDEIGPDNIAKTLRLISCGKIMLCIGGVEALQGCCGVGGHFGGLIESSVTAFSLRPRPM